MSISLRNNSGPQPLALVQASKLQHVSGSSLPSLLGPKGRNKPTRIQTQIVAQTDEAGTIQAARMFLQQHGNQLIGQMHLNTQRTYVQGIVAMNATANAGYDAESAADIKRWNTMQKAIFERHLSSNLEAGVIAVQEQVEKRFDLDDEQDGLLTRLKNWLI